LLSRRFAEGGERVLQALGKRCASHGDPPVGLRQLFSSPPTSAVGRIELL
jgi:hypothetical protein